LEVVKHDVWGGRTVDVSVILVSGSDVRGNWVGAAFIRVIGKERMLTAQR